MRVVIYDEESLEPITVVNLPGLTDRALEEKRHWRMTLPSPQAEGGDVRRAIAKPRYVDLEFDKISRVSLHHGVQETWLCLTRATELAMLLVPDWLPGQRPAIERLQEENARLASLMESTITSL
ncbi:hypothetical protein GCM10011371_10590 [Novosphingobium marinum]|uniref:Uncharacterized protein n=1 Tax=Novosphingobium marinum TaxID=1514948 RepID=A0A7Y9XXP3_9SPHN|nr:hypothetical protein [Novosphingobium marinum]NYH95168.1 hypothetical protein [Novosphingobium marinum]GGC24869.1 hypothetical protein GCM10011371_10590 [Novosphingobium marinum]